MENHNGFNYPTLDTSVDFSPHYGLYSENRFGNQLLYVTSLTLGSQVQVRVGGTGNGRAGRDAASDGRVVVLSATTRPYVLSPGQRVPLNQSLGEWNNPQGDSVKLVVRGSSTGNEVRLCLDQHVQNIKRLTCTLWQIPVNNDAADELSNERYQYQGITVTDERDGRPYTWRSTTSYPAYREPAISTTGIRGDVLAAVLVHNTNIAPAWFGMDFHGWSGKAWSGPNPSDQPLDIEMQTLQPSIEGWSMSDWGSALDSTQTHYTHTFNSFLELDPSPHYHFISMVVDIGLDVPKGRAYDGYDGDDNDGNAGFDPGHFLFNVDREIKEGYPLLTLSPLVTYSVGDTGREGETRGWLLSDHVYTARAGEVVPFHQVLQRWQDGQGNQVELLVLDGHNADEFRLCLNQQLPGVKRQSCSHFLIPAGWKLDIPPRFRGISVTDDRSLVGGSGLHYWQTPPGSYTEMR